MISSSPPTVAHPRDRSGAATISTRSPRDGVPVARSPREMILRRSPVSYPERLTRVKDPERGLVPVLVAAAKAAALTAAASRVATTAEAFAPAAEVPTSAATTTPTAMVPRAAETTRSARSAGAETAGRTELRVASTASTPTTPTTITLAQAGRAGSTTAIARVSSGRVPTRRSARGSAEAGPTETAHGRSLVAATTSTATSPVTQLRCLRVESRVARPVSAIAVSTASTSEHPHPSLRSTGHVASLSYLGQA